MDLPTKLRGGGNTYADPCGCEWQGQRWLKLCPTHLAEAQEIHARAMADYRAAQAEKAKPLQVPEPLV